MRKDYLITSAVFWAVMLPVWLVVQSCSAVHGDEPPESIQRLLEASRAAHANRIVELEQRIKRTTTSRERIPNRGQVLKDLKAELKSLRTKKFRLIIPDLTHPLRQGEIGVLQSRPKVLQVLGTNEMLVTLSFSRPAIMETSTVDVLLRGFKTEGNSDGAIMVPSLRGRAVEVTGTDTYETVTGATRTVFVIEPFSTDKLDEFLPKN